MAAQLSFAGKVAIITGASSGIGAATAILFSQLGANLSLGGRNKENLETVDKKCKDNRSDAEVLIVQGDLKSEDYVKNLVNTTIQHYGKLDILVNSAGILAMGSIENTSLESFDEVMNVNVRSIFHLTSLAVPHLIKTKGCIVNVSSVNGLRSFPGLVAYNVSKSAVDQLTRCVALELASKKVRCNAVNPGVTISELQKRGANLDEQAYQQFLEKSKTTHALGRPGNPEEVASAIAFLANDKEASYITGVTLPVDGGRHAMCPR